MSKLYGWCRILIIIQASVRKKQRMRLFLLIWLAHKRISAQDAYYYLAVNRV